MSKLQIQLPRMQNAVAEMYICDRRSVVMLKAVGLGEEAEVEVEGWRRMRLKEMQINKPVISKRTARKITKKVEWNQSSSAEVANVKYDPKSFTLGEDVGIVCLS